MNEQRRAGSPSEMAKIYSIPEGSLANMRCRKVGPRYFRVGRKVLYFFQDFEAWLRKDPVLTVDSLPEQND